MPLVMPNSLQQYADCRRKCSFVASLRAVSNQTDSEVVRIQISWDGSWEDGDTEMQRHMVVKELVPDDVA